MRRAILIFVALALAGPLAAQQVVDRIVARVEDDIITLSEVRELEAFQRLLEGQAAGDEQAVRQLVEQWIVNTEATASRFARPSEQDVNRELEKVEKQFPSPEAYRARLRELGLKPPVVRRLMERQLYLTRYLDYKFRPAAQVDAAQVEQYYRDQLTPQLRARGQAVPPLEDVEEKIRELLTQREISQRAGQWLEETRGRLRIEISLGDKSP